MIREAVSCSVIPMIIGDNKYARRLARRLFWRFSVRSHIFDTECSLQLRIMMAAVFSPIPKSVGDEFILYTIERFALERDGMTYLLIPSTKKAKCFIERNRDALDSKFMIRSYSEMMDTFRNGAESPFVRA